MYCYCQHPHTCVYVVLRDPLAQFEVEKREHEMKMHKMEGEMEEVFDMKVQEKLQKLKDIEADVSVGESPINQNIIIYVCFVRVVKSS